MVEGLEVLLGRGEIQFVELPGGRGDDGVVALVYLSLSIV